ncbi:replicative DNA helicase [Nonomuraea sp. K274]|uniref:Replicative DNA helicase n=1 Tax=Nonomuraea cypriaca TaxID=1187855 RepID=A0A931EZD8_9ACTN|nr:replicative DNA helicase [Nonomuraea cypriaca]
MEAEQSVLGGMLLSKDAIADVVEILRSDDFYRPAHQMVYDIITDLYGRGEPADAVTVFDELQKRGEMARVGGAAYLHTLTAVVPTAANAGYYAKIVREQAILRRLIEAGTRIVSFGYGGQNEEVDDLVDRAQAEIYKVTERRTSEDYAPLADIMPGALDELEAIGSRGGQMVGVPTGFQDLDQLTNGLHPGQMIVVAARPAIGKALALDTPLPTATGWTTMGEVRTGDRLLGADGRPTRVVAATEVLHGRPCYEVEFSDGTMIVADALHQWHTTEKVMTTEEIAADVRQADGRPGHAVPVAAPFALDEQDLPLPPYTLGAWLGAARSAAAHEQGVLRKLGVLEEKHIPPRYLRASERQRRHLLSGLLDAAGTAGRIHFQETEHRLAADVHELLLSLGHQATMHARPGTEHLVEYESGAPVRHIADVRRVETRPVRCVEVDNDDHLYLAGRACIPTHNSTLGLDFARSAAIKHGMTTVIFSLEMSRNEITMRLLSAEARVALHAMRSGMMGDDDWTRLARRMSEVAEAPLFIDDSPNMSMMEIRAKCRRLKQRNDLRFVVIDYLQLMSSPKKTESRQNEVSEISRAIKLLAKELEVPVIAISQLNRGPEQRTDKRPMVSDLRESGCLTAATRLLRADTGAEVTLGELLESGARDIPVWSLDDRLKLVPRTMTHAFPSGVQQVYRVRLRSGREVEATANHPFLTYDGWRALADLMVGTRVAVPRHMPTPLDIVPWDEDELVLLAHLIGDGSFVRRQPVRYSSTDETNLATVAEAARRRFGITAVRDDHEAARCTSLRLPAPYRLTHGKRNPIAAWLDGLGLFGLRSHEKFLPQGIFALPKPQLALFLRHLWATDGSVTTGALGHVRIYYGTTSERMARELQLLLLRFDVKTRLRSVGNTYGRPQWTLDVGGAEDQRRFLEEIGVHGEREREVAKAMARLSETMPAGRFDTVPPEVWGRVREVMIEQSKSLDQVQTMVGTRSRGDLNKAISPSRGRLRKIANVLGDAELEMFATNDVFWDEITSIESLGEQPVYDATVMGTHNFLGNGIHLKNSIEQDADMVILLHREDAYERESPRAGEADLIVAKHRNGPVATVTVAFQGHYSRFVDMAQH